MSDILLKPYWLVLLLLVVFYRDRYTVEALSSSFQTKNTLFETYRSLASFAANEVAASARAEILPYWRKLPEDMAYETKYDQDNNRSVSQTTSPVTIADRNAEQAMRKLILNRYPDHGVVGEEFGSHNKDAEYCWVLDPIDGTKSFITGKPLFGTLIGLCHNGVPVVGVIDHPATDEQWVGIVAPTTTAAAKTTTTDAVTVTEEMDIPAATSVATMNGTPIHTRSVESLQDAILYATTPHMFREDENERQRFEKVRDACQIPLYGADCYGYALVASGFGAHLVVEADLGVYDYAAVVPVVTAAGGVMTDWRGQPLTLQNHSASKGRVIAAADAQLHEQALELLRGES